MTVTFSLVQALNESRIQGTRSMKHLLNNHELLRVRKHLLSIEGRRNSFLFNNWMGPSVILMADAGFHYSRHRKQQYLSWLFVVCIFARWPSFSLWDVFQGRGRIERLERCAKLLTLQSKRAVKIAYSDIKTLMNLDSDDWCGMACVCQRERENSVSQRTAFYLVTQPLRHLLAFAGT